MGEVLKLLLALVEQRTIQRGRDAAGRIATAIGFAILAALSGMAALAMAVAALWFYMIPYAGRVGASLIAAGLLLGLCLLLLLGGRLVLRRRHGAPPPPPTDVLLGEATRLMQEHKGSLLLAAVLAGLFASNRVRAR